ERRCWIKAEPTFEGLRQILLEPEERVHVGTEPPTRGAACYTLDTCQVQQAPWLQIGSMSLNPGLVTIIGPRGSGKTALAELIAIGAHSFGTPGNASFLKKAGELAEDAHVTLVWGDNESDAGTVREVIAEGQFFVTPKVRYLSQHFVEQLCNPAGSRDAL